MTAAEAFARSMTKLERAAQNDDPIGIAHIAMVDLYAKAALLEVLGQIRDRLPRPLVVVSSDVPPVGLSSAGDDSHV